MWRPSGRTRTGMSFKAGPRPKLLLLCFFWVSLVDFFPPADVCWVFVLRPDWELALSPPSPVSALPSRRVCVCVCAGPE